MNVEAGIVFVVILVGLGFFFLLLPLSVVLARLPRIWKEQKGVAAFLLGLVVLTAFFFAIFLAGLVQITFGVES